MAQKKGLAYRLIMGKDNKPDFTVSRLPGTRWGVFKDVFLGRIGAMAKVSLLTFLFTLPAIIWFVYSSLYSQADSVMTPYSSNLGLGYPVVIDAVEIGQARDLMNTIRTFLISIPLVMFAGLGFAGAFQTLKRISWGEGVPVAPTFFKGIKDNWLQFMGIFLYLGTALFVLMYSISAYNAVYSMSGGLRGAILALGIVQFVIALNLILYMTTQTVTYKLGILGVLKNSMLFSIALLPQNLFFIALSLLPVVLVLLLPVSISMLLWILIAVLGFSYMILIWTVFAHWVFDKYVNDHVKGAVKNRGMYVPNKEEDKRVEIERIRTRATKYGAAYASRRLSSIDDGKSFTPLETNFTRADLARLSSEKKEMQEEMEAEIDRVTAELEEEQRVYEESLKSNKKKKQNLNPKKKKAKNAIDEPSIPVSDEEYKEN